MKSKIKKKIKKGAVLQFTKAPQPIINMKSDNKPITDKTEDIIKLKRNDFWIISLTFI